FACSTTRRIQKYTFDEAIDPAYPYAFQVPRAEFDEVLLDHAAFLGAEVREEWEAREVVFDGSRAAGAVVRPTRGQAADEERVRARFVVDATGRDTFLGTRRAGKKRLPKLDQSAIFTHWRNVWREDGRDSG